MTHIRNALIAVATLTGALTGCMNKKAAEPAVEAPLITAATAQACIDSVTDSDGYGATDTLYCNIKKHNGDFVGVHIWNRTDDSTQKIVRLTIEQDKISAGQDTGLKRDRSEEFVRNLNADGTQNGPMQLVIFPGRDRHIDIGRDDVYTPIRNQKFVSTLPDDKVTDYAKDLLAVGQTIRAKYKFITDPRIVPYADANKEAKAILEPKRNETVRGPALKGTRTATPN